MSSPNCTKVIYTMTADDVANGYAAIRVLWRAPMNNNYTSME